MLNNWLKKSLIYFGVAVLLVLTFPTYAYLSVGREAPIPLKPAELLITPENGGFRCPMRRWDSLSEGPICYSLQARLEKASREGNTEDVLESLRLGANVDGSYYQSDTAINSAAIKGNDDVVRLLIENGADVNSLGKWHESPLQFAALYGQLSIARTLLENGADVCHEAISDELGTPTALDLAVGSGDFQMIRLLTAFGAPFCLSQYKSRVALKR